MKSTVLSQKLAVLLFQSQVKTEHIVDNAKSDSDGPDISESKLGSVIVAAESF
jgi:hypothetical protein